MTSFTSRSLRSALLATSVLAGGVVHAGTLPTGGSVAAGSASIAAGATTMTVTQTSNRAVINWGSFSVGQGNSVVFDQPGAGAAVLNRVTGSAASTIAGAITANGSVYLVNANGIALTPTGTVQTGGGFVASTLDIADADFMAGKLNFAGKGSSATVSNAGSITAGQGAFVALLGGQVANSGTVAVPLGRIGLASGEQVTLDINGGQFLQVAVPTSALAGSNALVSNSGSLTAGGGTVLLKAATLKTLVRSVINLSGSINADSATGDGGTIRLLGGDGGTVTVSGTLSAKATGASGNGGIIETSGQHVALAGASVSTASAAGKPGTWTIDPVDFTIGDGVHVVGDITGGALSSALGSGNVTILSSAGAAGTNGDIKVSDAVTWSAGTTLKLSAFRHVALNAPVTGSGVNAGLVLQADNTGTGTGTVTFGGSTGGGSGAALAYTGSAALADASATVKIYYNPVTFGTPTNFSAITTGGRLTAYELVNTAANLQAINSKNLNENYALGTNLDLTSIANFVPLGTNGGGAVLNSYGFTGSFDGLGHTISNLKITRGGANYVGLFGYVSNPSGLSQDFSNVSFVNASIAGHYGVGALIGGQTNYGQTATLNNDSVAGNVTGSATGASPNTQNANFIGGLAGYLQNASVSASSSSATVNGGSTGNSVGGLIGNIGNGSVSGSSATGAVSGLSTVGGLVGGSSGTITNSSASGNVSAAQATINGGVNYANSIGGLAGYAGDVTNSSASGAVTVTGINAGYIGGLVGSSGGNNVGDNASGAVSVTGASANYVGGLVGTGGAIDSSGATGTVTVGTGAFGVGGLSGQTGSVTNSHSEGAVTAGNSANSIGGLVGYYNGGSLVADTSHSTVLVGTSSSYIGGLIGQAQNSGAVSQDAAYGNVTAGAGSGSVGGLIGYITSSSFSIDSVTASGNVIGGNDSNNVGGLIGQNNSSNSISNALATGAVSGGNDVGGLIGSNNASITASSATGTVTQTVTSNSQGSIGGLVGSNSGALFQVSASGNVGVASASFTTNYIGGLAGYNNAAVNQSYATGTVNGGGKSNYVGGLIGQDGSNSIIGSYATGAVTGGNYVGGLVGYGNDLIVQSYAANVVTASANGAYAGGLIGYGSGSVTQSFATGAVSSTGGNSDTGGLAGQYSGSVTQSYAIGPVSDVGNGSWVGGLVGYLPSGSIVQSYAAGPVNAGVAANAAGGLVGYFNGTIAQSFAVGSVTADFNTKTNTASTQLGGLVGYSGGSIRLSYATGNVSGGASSTYLGGLVGREANGLINQSYASGNVSGGVNASGLGGLVGQHDSGLISQAYAAGNVVGGTGSSNIGGLVGNDNGNGTLDQTYAVGLVSGGSALGGLIGFNNGRTGNVSRSVWNTQTTGQAQAAGDVMLASGATGRTTAQMQDYTTRGTIYAGWDFTNIWSPPTANGQAGQTQGWYPQLYAVTPVVVANPDNAARLYGAANPIFTGTIVSGGISRYQLGQVGDVLPMPLLFGTSASAASSVGTYAIGVASGGTALSNKGVAYRVIVPTAATLTINPAPLTLTYSANGASSVYGGAIAPVSGTVTGAGFVNGEGVGNLLGAAAWTTGATSASVAGSYAITGSGLTSGNYAITAGQAAGNATAYTINPAALTITYTATAASRTYGAANPVLAGTVAASGLVNGDTLAAVTTGTAAWTTAAGPANSIGGYAITGSGLVGASGNYAFNFVQAAGNATAFSIKPAALTVTYSANAASRAYGAANPALTGTVSASGLVNGNTLAGVTTGTVAWSIAANAASAVGKYGVTGSGLSASGFNYAISFVQAAGNSTALSVTPAALSLTYTANAASSVYGKAVAPVSGVVSGSGFVNGETLASLGGTAAWTTGVTSASGAGSYAITGNGLTSSNYAITATQAAGNATAYSVTPAPLLITYSATPTAMTYGAAVPVLGGSGTASGLVNGDTLLGTAGFVTSATSQSSVGSYGVTGSGLSASANYTVTSQQAPGNVAALTINPASLLVTYTATPASMTYGGSVPALTGSYSTAGLVNGDAVTGTAAFATTAGSSSPVGNYAIAGSGIGGGANYVVIAAQAAANATALAVNPAPLDVLYTANTASMTYGGAIPVVSGAVAATGLVNGDTLASLSGAATWETFATPATGAGRYQIVGYGLTSRNYAIRPVQATGNAAALTINPAALTLAYTAAPVSRVYGSNVITPTGTVVATGLVNGDTVATVATGTAKFTTNVLNTSNAGAYAITGSGLTAASPNYTIAFGQAAGNATAYVITKAPITVTYTATPVSRVYGDANPALGGTFTATGFKLTDTAAAILGGSAAFTTAATAASNAGKYAINGAGLTTLSGNYTIAAFQAAANGTALTITKAPLTITYTANAISQTYKALNLGAYTGTAAVTGLVNGNTQAAVVGGTARWTTTATNATDVGNYAITGYGLSLLSANYSLNAVQAPTNAAALTINPATLVVTYKATASSSKVGAALAALTGTATSSLGIAAHPEIFGGTAVFSTTATTASPAGSYAITGSGIISVNADYVLSAVQAAFNATAYTIVP